MDCPHCGAKITPAEAREAVLPRVIAMREGGASIGLIARELGLGRATVHSYLAGTGLERVGLRPGPAPSRGGGKR
jgi:predicted transcriptional regulator